MDMHKVLKEFQAATGFPMTLRHKDGNYEYFGEVFLPTPAVVTWNGLPYNSPAEFMFSPEYMLYGRLVISDEFEVFLGPVSSFECNKQQVYTILKRINQPLSRADEFILYITSIPTCTQERFQAGFRFLSALLGMDVASPVLLPWIETTYNTSEMKKEDYILGHHDIKLEAELLQCVKSGNVDQLKQLLYSLDTSGENMPVLSKDIIRTLQYEFIISTTLVSRSAIQGGLNYSLGLAISEYHLKQVEKLDTYQTFQRYLFRMFFDFTSRVASCCLSNSNSLLVQQICADAYAHLNEPLSVSDIAKNLKMDRTYLCRHFKEQTQRTIGEYIRLIKMKEAERLLKVTDLSLAQIATNLGFSSQNHFQTVFKNVIGITPQKYRMTV